MDPSTGAVLAHALLTDIAVLESTAEALVLDWDDLGEAGRDSLLAIMASRSSKLRLRLGEVPGRLARWVRVDVGQLVAAADRLVELGGALSAGERAAMARRLAAGQGRASAAVLAAVRGVLPPEELGGGGPAVGRGHPLGTPVA